MKLCMIGTGYVGLVSGVCFSDLGNTVYCVDNNKNKIDLLNDGKVPIYEPGIEPLVLDNQKKGTLLFTTNIKDSLDEATIVFIAVGTPMGDDGSADLKYVVQVARDCGKYMNDYTLVVTKSTVPVGTSLKVKNAIQEELDKSSMPSLDLIGVNNRNLKTFEVSLEYSKQLAAKIPDEFVKVSESGISSVEAVKELQPFGFQGFLMGEHFMKTENPGLEAKKFIQQLLP